MIARREVLLGVAATAVAPGIGPPSVEEWTVAATQVAARLYRPARATGCAVLLLAGSEGSYPPAELARALAAGGNPTLDLAYFVGNGPPIPGLPERLREIPLEYFDRALDRLAAATGRPLALIGESRGAEAALLVATRRPDVRALVAFAPSSAAWEAMGTGGSTPAAPAWTVGGQPVPFLVDSPGPGLTTRGRFERALAASGAARIPIDRIRARTLLVAGEDDRIWPSLPMARDVADILRSAGRDVAVAGFGNAGHLLMGPGPGTERIVTPDFTIEFGGTRAGNRAARDEAWRRTLALLRAVGRDP